MNATKAAFSVATATTAAAILYTTRQKREQRLRALLAGKSVDIKADHNAGDHIIADREFYSTDLEAFDKYVALLRSQTRSSGDEPMSERFWSLIRDQLKLGESPHGYNPSPNPGVFVVKSDADVKSFMARMLQLVSVSELHPLSLSKQMMLPLSIVLRELFYATKIGMVSMQWTPECSRCGGVVCARSTLESLPKTECCKNCEHRNDIDKLDGVKVMFKFLPEIMYAPSNWYNCPVSSERLSFIRFFGFVPPSMVGSGFTFAAGIDPRVDLGPVLPPGKYCIFCPVGRVKAYLHIRGEATEEDPPLKVSIKASQHCNMADARSGGVNISYPHGRLAFECLADRKSFFSFTLYNDITEDQMFNVPQNEREPFASASTCIHHPSFQKLFSKQVVSDGSGLVVSRVVLVFTDIVGSTAMYSKSGDGPALAAVQRHFQVLFQEFSITGRIVKTVGDCVMAAFPTGEAALTAVAKALDGIATKCRLPDGSPLEIRVGIHAGDSLMIPLNGINDYFGSTVNIAARVESKANARECLISESVFYSDPDSQNKFNKLLAKGYGHTRDVKLELKGVDGYVAARGFSSKIYATYGYKGKVAI
ncbi:MAG: hypothetical protein SGBAC_001405 [Bacillariaceae sp.]